MPPPPRPERADIALIVEEPGESFSKVMRRVYQLLHDGVPAVWLVDSLDRCMSVYSRNEVHLAVSESDDRDGIEALPDARCSVREFFAALAPITCEIDACPEQLPGDASSCVQRN